MVVYTGYNIFRFKNKVKLFVEIKVNSTFFFYSSPTFNTSILRTGTKAYRKMKMEKLKLLIDDIRKRKKNFFNEEHIFVKCLLLLQFYKVF